MVQEFTLSFGIGHFFKKKKLRLQFWFRFFDELICLPLREVAGIGGLRQWQGWSADGPCLRAKRIIESDTGKTKAAWGVFEEI